MTTKSQFPDPRLKCLDVAHLPVPDPDELSPHRSRGAGLLTGSMLCIPCGSCKFHSPFQEHSHALLLSLDKSFQTSFPPSSFVHRIGCGCSCLRASCLYLSSHPHSVASFPAFQLNNKISETTVLFLIQFSHSLVISLMPSRVPS